jgi:hypothetical protein
MDIQNFYEEVIVFGLLLLAVVGIYIMLKLHYHFAFGLMKNTASYEKHKSKIDKAREYVFFTLKVLLWIVLIGTTIFSFYYLSEGMSLKVLVFEWWSKIPDGFWIKALLVIIRIALIIVLSRYILKFIYGLLDTYEQKALENRCRGCSEVTIIKFYKHIHNMLKYTVLLGILYRITLFFPFLEMISRALWILLILYLAGSFILFVKNSMAVIKEKRENIHA